MLLASYFQPRRQTCTHIQKHIPQLHAPHRINFKKSGVHLPNTIICNLDPHSDICMHVACVYRIHNYIRSSYAAKITDSQIKVQLYATNCQLLSLLLVPIMLIFKRRVHTDKYQQQFIICTLGVTYIASQKLYHIAGKFGKFGESSVIHQTIIIQICTCN